MPSQSIDDLLIKRKNVKKMFVSRDGNHAILLAEHELFYNNWNDNQIIQLDKLLLDSMEKKGTRVSAFKSVDILQEGDSTFDILLGTQDGQVFHAALDYSDGNFEVLEPFANVLELPDGKAILDIKIASIGFAQNIVLAITDSSLYYISGEYMIKELLMIYKQDKSKIMRSQLTLEATIQGVDLARHISAQEDDVQ